MNSSYYVDTSYGVSNTTGLLSVIAGFGIFIWIISMAVSILMIVSMWKIFTKAGKPGWAAIIPFYNIYIMCEIAGKEWWYILLSFVPIANIYAMFVIYNEIAKKFGKTTGFTIGMMFLPVIFFPILAFGKDNIIREETQVQNNLDADANLTQMQSNATNVEEGIATVDNKSLATSSSVVSNEYVAPSFETVGPTEPVNNNMTSNGVFEQSVVMPTAPVQEEINPVSEEQPVINSVQQFEQPIMNNPAVTPVTQSVEQPVVTPAAPVQEEVTPASVEQPVINSAPQAEQPIMNNPTVTPVTQSVEQPVVTPVAPVQEGINPLSVEQPVVNPVPETQQPIIDNPINPNNVQPVVDNKSEVHTSLWSNNNTDNNQM